MSGISISYLCKDARPYFLSLQHGFDDAEGQSRASDKILLILDFFVVASTCNVRATTKEID